MSRADHYRPLFAQLGERVKSYRSALGLTLEEVGTRAGLAEETAKRTLKEERRAGGRVMRVHGVTITEKQIAVGLAAMKPGRGGCYWENWDIVQALLPVLKPLGLNSTYVADRLLQRERRAGRIRHIGGGKWVRN